MIATATTPGPFGPVLIPAEPEAARRYAIQCCKQLFAGEYDYAGGPETFAVRGVERGGFEAGHDTLSSVVDVGANVGAFVVWAKTWWPALRHVTSYEPNPLLHPLFRANVHKLGLDVELYELAVTTAPTAVLEDAPSGDWAGNFTYRATKGRAVTVLHPDALPPADALKVDAEGVEVEVLEHYRHWPGVRVCLFEYHFAEHVEPLEAACARAGLVRARHHGAHLHEKRGQKSDYGIQVWIRG
jgi:FkbM family methyltransferase